MTKYLLILLLTTVILSCIENRTEKWKWDSQVYQPRLLRANDTMSRSVMLISKEFIILISIAFIVAVPLGYYFMNKWLQDFAYRINLTWWMFALAGASVIAAALLTMSFQAVKAALMNPVKNLRSE